MRGRWYVLILAVVLGGALGGVYWYLRRHRPAPQQTAPAADVQLPAGTEVQFQAAVHAPRTVDVAAPVEGVLEDFPIKPGDEVVEGQELGRIRNAQLDQAEKDSQAELESITQRVNALESTLIAARLEDQRLSADLSRARGEAARTEKAYQRQSLLVKEGATPRRAYEAAEKDFNTARGEHDVVAEQSRQASQRLLKMAADLDALKKTLAEKQQAVEDARADLRNETVRAPVDGVLVSIARPPGSDIPRGLPDLFKIAADLATLEVVAEPPPNIALRLRPGLPVAVVSLDTGSITPGAIRDVKDGRVVIEFMGVPQGIRPGMSVIVRVQLP